MLILNPSLFIMQTSKFSNKIYSINYFHNSLLVFLAIFLSHVITSKIVDFFQNKDIIRISSLFNKYIECSKK
jgi:hypothetical protein